MKAANGTIRVAAGGRLRLAILVPGIGFLEVAEKIQQIMKATIAENRY
jgi:hypothetical protein